MGIEEDLSEVRSAIDSAALRSGFKSTKIDADDDGFTLVFERKMADGYVVDCLVITASRREKED